MFVVKEIHICYIERRKVFVVNQFHLSHKETMEGVCQKPQLVICYKESENERHWSYMGFSHLLQGEGYRRYLLQVSFTSVARKEVWKAFTIT